MILVTGTSGFLGHYVVKELFLNNILFKSVSRNRDSEFYFDFSTFESRFSKLGADLEVVIHIAGLAHKKPQTTKDSELFFRVNSQGTLAFLKKLEVFNLIPKKFVFISSVSVYGASEGLEINEFAPTNALDPYGLSKFQAEKIIEAWCIENQVDFYILRLPLIAGFNPPGNLGAMLRGMTTGKYARIGNGLARKSIVLASDVARFITNIKGPSGIYNLTDGYHPSFAELEEKIITDLKLRKPKSIPFVMGKAVSLIGDIFGDNFPLNSRKFMKLNSTLTFSDKKAKDLIGWNPRLVLEYWDLKR